MKNLFIAILCFMSYSIYAEEVAGNQPGNIMEVNCPTPALTDVCEIVMDDGKSIKVPAKSLDKYLSVDPTAEHDMDDVLFLYGYKSRIVSLNPKSFGGSQQAAPVQQAAEPPYRLSTIDGIDSINPMDRAVKLVVTSIVSGLIVEEVVINEGSCLGYSRKKDQWRTTVPVLPMGKDIKIPMPGCTPIKVVVTTNMGSWTHSF